MGSACISLWLNKAKNSCPCCRRQVFEPPKLSSMGSGISSPPNSWQVDQVSSAIDRLSSALEDSTIRPTGSHVPVPSNIDRNVSVDGRPRTHPPTIVSPYAPFLLPQLGPLRHPHAPPSSYMQPDHSRSIPGGYYDTHWVESPGDSRSGQPTGSQNNLPNQSRNGSLGSLGLSRPYYPGFPRASYLDHPQPGHPGYAPSDHNPYPSQRR